MKFVVGVIVGIVIATVGFAGVARIMDRGVEVVQDQARNLSR